MSYIFYIFSIGLIREQHIWVSLETWDSDDHENGAESVWAC